MAAPSPDLVALAASTTSSGFADGLGRRALAFDREEGTMLERLLLRPELAAFERMLRERVDRVAGLEDERIARPRTVERDGDGALVVVSEFVPGSRLSDLLDASAQHGVAPGVDAAFGYLLDALPALCGLHAGAGFAHGTIATSRTVLTPAGQVVLLDVIYGDALTLLRYSRHKLWSEFGVATPTSVGLPRLDHEADIAQVALCSMMLMLGRPLRADEYPGALPKNVREVADLARIRGTTAFADGLQDFLHRALPLRGSRPYPSADDALIDLRELGNELGLHACRRALVEFIEQMEPSGDQPAEHHPDIDDVIADIEAYGRANSGTEVDSEVVGAEAEQDLESAVEAEINLEALVEEPLYDLDVVGAIDLESELPPVDDPMLLSWNPEDGNRDQTPSLSYSEAPAVIIEEADSTLVVAPPDVVPVAPKSEPVAGDTHRPHADSVGEPEPVAGPENPEPAPVTHRVPHAAMAPPVATEPPAAPPEPVEAVREVDTTPTVRSRRAKRARSTRSRRDKLRSVSSAPPAAEVPSKSPAVNETEGLHTWKPSESWLVPPDRAAAFEPVGPEPSAAPAPPPFRPPDAPPAFSVPTPPLTPPAAPRYPPPPQLAPTPPAMPTRPGPSGPVGVPAPYSTTTAWVPPTLGLPPPIGLQAGPASSQPAATPQPVTLKLKETAKRPQPPRAQATTRDIYTAPAMPPTNRREAGAFPWKLAAAAVVLVAIALVGGRGYLPGMGASEGPSPDPAAGPSTRPAAVTTLPATVGNTGRLEIETQPAGARVLLDGKPAGESPLTIDRVPVGRHTVTFVSSSGSVRRTVRVEAGRTAKLDVPIFSGWVGIYAPFVVVVAESGRVIGTTEEPRLMLSPGRHVLTLTNKELGYISVQTVHIEPGEVRSLSLDPRGSVNLNASPWAEVWIDGKKVGETPIANQRMPLGVREVIFRHPQFGERRVAVTVRGNEPAAVSVEMSKP